MLLEERLEMQPERELDGLTGSARRRDDDDATGRRLSRDECISIGREVSVLDGA